MSNGLHALIRTAVAGLDEEEGADGVPSPGWRAIWHLHRMPCRETLDAATQLCRSADPMEKRTGAAILGQLGHVKPGFRPGFVEERFQALHGLLLTEQKGAGDAAVLNAVCVALGHSLGRIGGRA